MGHRFEWGHTRVITFVTTTSLSEGFAHYLIVSRVAENPLEPGLYYMQEGLWLCMLSGMGSTSSQG